VADRGCRVNGQDITVLQPLTPAQREWNDAYMRTRGYSGFHMVCPDCFALEPLCRCQPSPKPSLWRRLLRKGA
jgi:hypothetical protein